MPLVTIVVPTLHAGDALAECLRSLAHQTCRDFDVTVIDNSGRGLVRQIAPALPVEIIEPANNVGFGTAINLGYARSQASFVATLNDDAKADPGWLEALLAASREHPEAGMFASQVRLSARELDSAGMLLCADGSSKQRGHRQGPEQFGEDCEALLPSGSAAMYRRAMLDQTGGFDDRFFLYCEDTDLGLRGQWAGWHCVYVAGAVVQHRYSHSAGRVSPLKAYYVERNRLFLVIKNFPFAMLAAVPLYTAVRYFWHVVSIFTGRGAAGEFTRQGTNALLMLWLPLRILGSFLAALPYLRRERRKIRSTARISAARFGEIARTHSISPREVAAL